MAILLKPAVVIIGLLTAYSGIQEPATQTVATLQTTISANRSIAASAILDALRQIDGVNTWRAVLTRSGYAPSGNGPVTILVPADAAFATGDERSLISLLGSTDIAKLEQVVKRTIIDQPLDPANYAGRKISVTTLAGNAVTFDATDQFLTVGDAEILAVKHVADGSIILIVDHLPMNSRFSDSSDSREHQE